jgi:hypothetical protein
VSAQVRLLLLGAWAGALVTWSLLVIPSAFATLPGTELAGALAGMTLDKLDRSGIALGVLTALLGLRATTPAPGARRRPLEILRALLPLAPALLHALSTFWISPEIRALREVAGGSLGYLPPGGPGVERFGTLHWLSTRVFALAAVMVLLAGAWDLLAAFLARRKGPGRH